MSREWQCRESAEGKQPAKKRTTIWKWQSVCTMLRWLGEKQARTKSTTKENQFKKKMCNKFEWILLFILFLWSQKTKPFFILFALRCCCVFVSVPMNFQTVCTFEYMLANIASFYMVWRFVSFLFFIFHGSFQIILMMCALYS